MERLSINQQRRGPCRGVVRSLTLILGLSGLAAAQVGMTAEFTDVTDSAGVTLMHQSSQTVTSLAQAQNNTVNHVPGLSNGVHLFSSWLTGGVAVADYDADGWPDLFVIGGDIGASQLFRNTGDGQFDDVTASVGLDMLSGRMAGAVFADFDGDQDPDLFLGGALEQTPRLLRNDVSTSGQFVDVFATALAGYEVSASPNAWGGAFGDFNNDGCLDLLIPRSLMPGGPSPTFKTAAGSTQHLWQNNCDGTFTDASLSAGIAQIFNENTFPVGGRDQTFTGNFSDINHDGHMDILFTGDIGTDLILINQGNGQFINVIDRFVINDKNAMGAAVGDFNNDGHIDWFTANIGMPNPGNRLFLGNGDGSFDNATDGSGVLEGHWGWGACALDINLDRHLDIFQVNGFYYPQNSNPDAPDGRYDNAPAVLFVSNGDGTFTERAAEYGLDDHGEGRGVSCFDHDRDGDPDIAISNYKGPFKLFRNDLGEAERNFITVILQGVAPNTEGIGATITLRSENPAEVGELMHEIRAGNNFLSSNLAEANFGLGDWQGPFTIQVNWPDGQIQNLSNQAGNQFLSVEGKPAVVFDDGFEL